MNYTELKKLAEAAPSGPWEVARFMAAASPDIVLGLIAQVEALKAELREGDDLRERLAGILTRSVNVIRGEPEPMSLHSWHDLPELVEALKADAERGRYMIMNGCWHRGEEQTHLAVLVPQGSDLSCYAMREAAIDAARSK